jgi:anti-sigma B factor antagonist
MAAASGILHRAFQVAGFFSNPKPPPAWGGMRRCREPRFHIRSGSRPGARQPVQGSEERGMQIEQRIVGDVAIVKVTGDITLGKGGDVILKDKINSLLQQGQRKLVLDLGDVSYVDSAGLGQLVQVHATTTRQGGTLKVLNVTKRLRDLLVVTKLLVVFDAFDSEADALASFKPAAV